MRRLRTHVRVPEWHSPHLDRIAVAEAFIIIQC
jgi:hypothetical protein